MVQAFRLPCPKVSVGKSVGASVTLKWRDAVHGYTRYFLLAAFMTWPASGFAQIRYPVADEVERNAFVIAGGGHKQGEPDFPLIKTPFGTPHPATNPEAMYIQEPTGRPTKASPNSPDK